MSDNLYRRALTALLDAAEARDFDPPVPTELVAALEHAAQEEADLKAQRDELLELLRDVARNSCCIESTIASPRGCGYCTDCQIRAALRKMG